AGALYRTAHNSLAEARSAISDPDKPDNEAVHDFRRAMKRWRALLRLIDPLVGAEARVLRDEARDLAGALAGARDPQSALDALAPRDWEAASPEELHEQRKRVVIHRYQIEIAEEFWPRFVKMWMGEAQRLRERLGRHQDLLVLQNLTGPHQPLARWRARLMPA